MSRPNPEVTKRTFAYSYQSYDPSGNITNPDSTRRELDVNRRSYLSVSTPGYPKVLRNNPHYSYINQWRREEGTFKDTNLSNGYYSIATIGLDWTNIELIPSGCPYSLIGVSHDPTSLRKALDAAMDEVKDSKVNLAQFIAERQQVVNMVNDIVDRITKSITAIRRRDFRSATRALGLTSNPRGLSKSVANNWLAYQYGWKPLLSDVKGAAEHLAQSHYGRPALIKVKKMRSYTAPVLSWVGRNSWGGPMTVIFNERKTISHVGLIFEVTSDLVRENQQLGITDPLTLAWELTPYSFVVDWFLPVGNFLQRLNYDSGLSFREGYTSQFTSQRGSAKDIKATILAGSRSFTGDCKLSWYHQAFDRIVLTEPPHAVLPSFKDPFSPVHTLNALALMRVAFGR